MPRRRLRRVARLALIFLAAVLVAASPAHAAPDDGYPPGQPAPGRTCPNSRPGQIAISPHNGKRFVCTLIAGTKRWWPPGTPLPTPSPSAPAAAPHMPPGYTPSYVLPTSALAATTVRRDIAYDTQSPAQKLDLYLPKGVTHPPLVIWIHGGAFVFGDKAMLGFDDSARALQTLLRNGLAVAGLNYRLADEAKFPAAGQDVKSAIRFLRANAATYGFDPTRFATWGESAGAYLAVMTGATGDQPSVFDSPQDKNRATSAAVSAVVDLFGNANFRTMRANLLSHPCGPHLSQPAPATVPDNPWFGDPSLSQTQAAIDKANMLPFLSTEKPLPAFFIFHGEEDCGVNPQDSRDLDARLRSLGAQSSLTLVPHAGHGDTKVWAAAASMGATLRSFFAHHG
jgi:acetyl esterase/lipase